MNCMIMSRISYDEKEQNIKMKKKGVQEGIKWGRKSYGLKEWCS